MKKYFSLIVLLVATITLGACGAKEKKQSNEGKLNIVTSFYPMYDFTQNITKDKANVSMLIDGGVEPHDYEPSAKDMAKIQEADVFIYNSNEMETWVETVLKNIDTTKVKVIEASKGIELLEASHSEEKEEGHEGHDHSGAHDPHVWLSPKLASKEAMTISEGIMEVDSKNKDFYEKNTKEYTGKLANLDNDYQIAFKGAKSRQFVTQHTAFSYLAHEYDLKQVPISGISPDQEPTPKELKGIEDFVKKEKIEVIYTESSASPKIAKTISSATGASLAVLNPMESVSKKDREKGEDYLSIMTQNLESLKQSVK
ncbi:metal ABC transporter substrate-binding protein [Vagococcus hydrophili]|uniref:Zinc ABC transporter substrate-binding protein n=1 Tax=Vagococcus hydrophili TaxID=2714947 RepID=A0A6G8AX27_9ENTE|nr:metal ABC transporter substrate-binding protein [Vagococcus hydrophili]QIL49505.1 zinc ABC transporter substrate-binding protein [Vagococcus hydrophili]